MSLENQAENPNKNEQDDNDASFQEENGVLFYVNRDGFPMSSKNWERMWRHVENIHPEKLKMVQRIRDNVELEKVPVVNAPQFSASASAQEKIEAIQDYMTLLQYPNKCR